MCSHSWYGQIGRKCVSSSNDVFSVIHDCHGIGLQVSNHSPRSRLEAWFHEIALAVSTRIFPAIVHNRVIPFCPVFGNGVHQNRYPISGQHLSYLARLVHTGGVNC